MIFLQLFWTFFKIGLFGFGGGYAMLSMIQGEIVTRHGWMTAQEFTDMVAISQMTPGPIGINAATYAGYTAVQHAGYAGELWGAIGSCVATGAVVLPSFILMLLISRFFMKYRHHPMVEAVFRALRPAVVGLLAAAALLLMTADNFGHPASDPLHFAVSALIFLVTLAASARWRANPVLLIVLAGAAGFLFF